MNLIDIKSQLVIAYITPVQIRKYIITWDCKQGFWCLINWWEYMMLFPFDIDRSLYSADNVMLKNKKVLKKKRGARNFFYTCLQSFATSKSWYA